MKKYKVYGTVTVNVTKEVWANSEDEAIEKAYEQLPLLTAYCGNGGDDKLVGVEEEGESVEVFDDIEYDKAKEIEDDPDYFECPECGEKCLMLHDDDGTFYWGCVSCDGSFDNDGNAFDPFFDEIELNDEEDEE
jgi:hypothetical protein